MFRERLYQSIVKLLWNNVSNDVYLQIQKQVYSKLDINKKKINYLSFSEIVIKTIYSISVCQFLYRFTIVLRVIANFK